MIRHESLVPAVDDFWTYRNEVLQSFAVLP